MNKKLISAAVAGALAVPAVAAAEQHTSVVLYGRINNALQYTDPDGTVTLPDGQVVDRDSTWGFRNVVSRLGVKASSDLGNGLTAIGRYEFFTYTNREGDLDAPGNPKGRGGINDTRLGYVGLSGAWGSVTIGNQWSSFYDIVGTHLDPTYSLGYFLYSSVLGGPYRTSNTIKYANSFGPVYLEWDLRMSHNDPTGIQGGFTRNPFADEEVLGRDRGEDLDGWGLGLSWNINDNFIIAGAYDRDKNAGAGTPGNLQDVDRIGLAGKFSAGAWFATLGWYQIDVGNPAPGVGGKANLIQGWVGGTFGKTTVTLGYGQSDIDNLNSDPRQWTLGVYHNMGGGFRLYFEGSAVDDKGTGVGQGKHNVGLFGFRYDFSM